MFLNTTVNLLQKQSMESIKNNSEFAANKKRNNTGHFWHFQLNVSLNVSICNYESFHHRKNDKVTRHNQNDCFKWIFQLSQFEIFKAETSLKMMKYYIWWFCHHDIKLCLLVLWHKKFTPHHWHTFLILILVV